MEQDSEQLRTIGRKLLQRRREDEDASLSSDMIQLQNDTLYLRSLALSEFITNLGRHITVNTPINQTDISKLHDLCTQVVNELDISGHPLSNTVEGGSSLFESYKVLGFASMLIANNTTTIQDEFSSLQRQYNELKALYKESSTIKQQPSDLTEQIAIAQATIQKYEGIISNLQRENEALKHIPDSQNNLQEELKAQIDENYKLKEQLEVEKTKKTTEQSNNARNAQVFILETDLSATQIRLKDTEERLAHIKSKYKTASKENKKLQEELRLMKLQNESLTFECEKIKHDVEAVSEKSESVSEEPHNTAEIDALTTALNEVTEHSLGIIDDLGTASDLNNRLINVVRQQQAALAFAEQNLQKQNGTVIDQTPCNHQIVSEKIAKMITKNYKATPFIEQLLNELETKNAIEAISNIVMILLDSQISETDSPEYQDLLEQNKRYGYYLMSLSNFLERFANSSDLQMWNLGERPDTDIRSMLQLAVSRVESFLTEHGINEEGGYCLKEIFEKYDEELHECDAPFVLEAKALLQLFSLAINSLTNYSEELAHQSARLLSDLRQMRAQLQSVEESRDADIEDAVEELNTLLQNEQKEKAELIESMKQIRENLRHSNGGLQSINDITKRLPSGTDDDGYLAEIEAQLEDLVQSIQATETAHQEQIADLESQKDELEDANLKQKQILNQWSSDYEHLKQEDEELREQNKTLQTELEELSNQLEEVRQTVTKQSKYIKDFEELKAKEIEQLKKTMDEEREQRISELTREIEEWRLHSEELAISAKQQLKEQRRKYKRVIKAHADEITIQERRADEIKNYFQPRMDELREQLQASKASEQQMRNEHNSLYGNIKALNSELTSMRVNQKVLQMKLTNAEEKLKRDRLAYEAQFKTRLINVDTESRANIDAVVQEHREFMTKLQKLLQLTNPPSEEVIIEAIQGIISETQQHEDELKALQDQLEVVNNSKPQTIEKPQTPPQQPNRDWELWARRLNALITDNFASHKNEADLRAVIEESLMNSIGQRRYCRMNEILKLEKGILLSGVLEKPTRPMPHSMRTVLFALSAVHQLQKLSGHLHGPLSLPTFDGEEAVRLNHQSKRWSIYQTE